MGRLDGKVALTSGGARGQGATEVRMFVREGARVVFGDVLDDERRRVEAAVRAAGGASIDQCLDRYYIAAFLARDAADIHGDVLEIADDTYTRRFGGPRVQRSG